MKSFLHSAVNSVVDFRKKLGLEVPTRFTGKFPPLLSQIRLKLIEEEVDEVEKAIREEEITDLAKELADVVYVLSGAVIEFGMQNTFPKGYSKYERKLKAESLRFKRILEKARTKSLFEAGNFPSKNISRHQARAIKIICSSLLPRLKEVLNNRKEYTKLEIEQVLSEGFFYTFMLIKICKLEHIFEAVFNETHRSNMTKKPSTAGSGKGGVDKSEYTPADIRGIFLKMYGQY
jgi:NTP pyrophosphatase (non-canonical NTP hydrolase)